MAAFYPINAPLVNYFFYNYTQTQSGSTIPIAGGKVFFYDDNDHLIEKPTYSDVSDPNNPVVNTNPLVLNDAGATPLYYAEPGLYYIVVTGPDGDLNNPVWTFEHVNFEGGAGNGGENVINYMPNGQFLLHIDLPAIDGYEEGEIRADTTNIAWGGWTFERSAGSTADDFVTFEKYTEYSANPTGNPLFSLHYQCTTFDSGDAYKGIRITYPDVNRFSSDTQRYTLSLQGIDNLAGSIPINIYLIKNFGTGGSTQIETLLTTVNLDSIITNYAYSFLFGNNSGKVIGSEGDDFVALEFRVPTNELIDINVTCFQQQAGTLLAPVYPETTQQQDITNALAGSLPIPDPLGADIGLPPILGIPQWSFDDSQIAFVFFSAGKLIPKGYLYCDGTQYKTSEYSSDGIPYARLQSKLADSTNNYLPIYGTGANYFSGINQSPLTILNNTVGSATAPSNGVTSPGFSFVTSLVGGKQQVVVTTVAANAIPGGAYFNIYGYFSAASVPYYVYYIVAGVGSDPAIPGATGIKVELAGTETDVQVAFATMLEINSAFFCVPDYRGLFFRGWDNGAGRDPDSASRTALMGTPGVSGDEVGTYQGYQIQSHAHVFIKSDLVSQNPPTWNSGGGTDWTLPQSNQNTTETGGNETRPINAYIMPVIKY